MIQRTHFCSVQEAGSGSTAALTYHRGGDTARAKAGDEESGTVCGGGVRRSGVPSHNRVGADVHGLRRDGSLITGTQNA